MFHFSLWFRNKGQGRMQVDRKEIGDSNSRSNYTMLNTDGELFLGKHIGHEIVTCSYSFL